MSMFPSRHQAEINEYGAKCIEYELKIQHLRSQIALRDRCIAWCLENTPYRSPSGKLYSREVPAEFAAIIGEIS